MTVNLSRPVSIVWLIAGSPWDIWLLLRSVKKQTDASKLRPGFPSHNEPQWVWNGMQMCGPYVGIWHHSFLIHDREPLFKWLLFYKHWFRLYACLAYVVPPVLWVVPFKTNLIWPQSKVSFLTHIYLARYPTMNTTGESGNLQKRWEEGIVSIQ